MSEVITYDAEALAAAAERAGKLKNAVEETQTQLERLYDALVSATGSLTGMPGGVSTSSVATLVSKKKLRAQAAKLEALVSVMNEAAELTDTATKNVQERLDLFGLVVEKLEAVAKPVAATVLAIANEFGSAVYDTLRTSVKEIIEAGTMTPEEIIEKVGSRDAAIMDIYESDKSPYLGRGSNLDTGEINCKYFTWRKIEQLLGSNRTKKIYSSAAMRSLNGQTITADNGTEYLVTTYDAKKASELVGSISQPAENIVLSFSGHLMMIDRIEDGMVYFSDNSSASWKQYESTGVYPTQVMTIDEFGKYYDKNNGNLDGAAYSLTKQS